MLICRQLSFLSLCLVCLFCLSPIILAFCQQLICSNSKLLPQKNKYDLKSKLCGSSGPKQVMEKDPGDFNSVARGHDYDGVTEVFHTKKEFSTMVLSAICSPSIILLILWLNHKHLQSG